MYKSLLSHVRESRKFLLVESWILEIWVVGSGIPLCPMIGIQNLSFTDKESWILDMSGIQNPSWTVLDSLHGANFIFYIQTKLANWED